MKKKIKEHKEKIKHHISKHKKKVSKHKGKIIAITVFVIAVFLFVMYQQRGGPDGDYSEAGTAKVDFYVMSQCPYGTQVEDAIAPVLKLLGPNIDFNLEFIASDVGGGQFNSLHGQPEVEGNIVQLCAIKYHPENHQYMDMVVCMNKNAGAIPGNWEKCAQDNNLDVEKIKACYKGDEGKQLLSESIKKAQAVNAQGSPTIYVNDVPYNGNRDSISFQRIICSNLDNHPECASLPKCSADSDCVAEAGKIGLCKNPGKDDSACEYVDPVKVDSIILTDKNCPNCNTLQITQVTQSLFPGVEERYVEVSSEEGKQLVEKYNIKFLPSYLFDKSVTETYIWGKDPRISGAFELVGDMYKLRDEATGASYFASEEARQEYYAAIGITTGDNKPQIDFFVMSYCPYGNQAEEAVEPVYQLLKDSAEFNPRYVIYANYGGGGPDYCISGGQYCSMHGIQELNQDVREICVNKYMGIDKWFEFAIAMNSKCSYKNADSCWEQVATDLSLDTAKIKECEQNEAEELIKSEFQLNSLLKVSGSPAVFVEGESYQGARTAEGYKAALCNSFETAPAECAEVLASSGAPAPTGQC